MEEVVPGVGRLVVVGIGSLGQNIGEGLLRVLLKGALGQRALVLVHLPDAQVGAAALRMLGRRDEFELPVMVKIGHGVIPGDLAVRLPELRQL